MRLKSFTAPTMQEAMRLVRAELGKDAVIVSTLQGRKYGGVRITAAVEQTEARELPAAMPQRALSGPARAFSADPAPVERIRCALEDHGVPDPVVQRLVNAARIIGGESADLALAAALDDCFRFAPLAEKDSRQPIMLVGPPGAGKTVTAAKLAARAALNRQGAALISTDTERPGGMEQLQGFASLMNVPLQTAQSGPELREAVGGCRLGDLVIIDTAGANPYADGGLEELGHLISASGAEPVLVLPAGGDARDSAMLADAFSVVGPSRLLFTRLDLTRRLGSLLAAADSAKLRFSNVCAAPGAATGFVSLNPVSLARLLLPGAVSLGASKTESAA